MHGATVKKKKSEDQCSYSMYHLLRYSGI